MSAYSGDKARAHKKTKRLRKKREGIAELRKLIKPAKAPETPSN